MFNSSHLLYCETLPEERSAGNPHATFCGNRWRATATDEPVGPGIRRSYRDQANVALAKIMQVYDVLRENILQKRNITGRDKIDLQTFFEEITVSLEPDLVVEIAAHDTRFSQNISERINTSIVAYEANKAVFNKYHEHLSSIINY